MRFLLSLVARYYNEELVKYALDFAKQKEAKLSVLFVLDSEVTSSIMEKLVDMGFIGERPSTELGDAVVKEYEAQALEQIEQIQKLADKEGLTISTVIKKGDFADETMAKAISDAADLIILNRERQGALSKLFKSSAVDELIRNAPCEVKIFES